MERERERERKREGWGRQRAGKSPNLRVLELSNETHRFKLNEMVCFERLAYAILNLRLYKEFLN